MNAITDDVLSKTAIKEEKGAEKPDQKELLAEKQAKEDNQAVKEARNELLKPEIIDTVALQTGMQV